MLGDEEKRRVYDLSAPFDPVSRVWTKFGGHFENVVAIWSQVLELDDAPVSKLLQGCVTTVYYFSHCVPMSSILGFVLLAVQFKWSMRH